MFYCSLSEVVFYCSSCFVVVYLLIVPLLDVCEAQRRRCFECSSVDDISCSDQYTGPLIHETTCAWGDNACVKITEYKTGRNDGKFSVCGQSYQSLGLTYAGLILSKHAILLSCRDGKLQCNKGSTNRSTD